VNDRQHGLQFNVYTIHTTVPTTLEGLEKYLASRMIKGIGPVYAKKLVAAFGQDVFDVIEREPTRLRVQGGDKVGHSNAGVVLSGAE
jgi:exodeoxyribonuclease V alpha subunit